MGYTVAIVGATGLVGRTMVEMLEKRRFPIEKLCLFASARSSDKKLCFNGEELPVRELTEKAIARTNADIALFSAGSAVSEKFAPIFVRYGTTVIDNSSRWRRHPAVPLIVPEVNSAEAVRHPGLIANPNCSTIQSVVAISPIHREYGIKRLIYATYQSVSGAGYRGLCDLREGTANSFRYPITDNLLPQIDEFCNDGYTREEIKMIEETRKILRDDDIGITATAVRVPIRYCHGVAVNLTTRRPFELKDIENALKHSPGVIVKDDTANYLYPTPLEARGKDAVYVGRVRKDDSETNALNLYVVSDNLHKGAALNAVQIAECLVENNSVRATKTLNLGG